VIIAGTGLQEYEDLLARTRISRPSLQRALRTLMQRQFIFGNDRGSRDIYDMLVDENVRPIAERLFDAFGWRLIYHTSGNVKMVGLMPPLAESDEIPRDKREAYHAPTLRVDEAIAVLLLRAFFENAIHAAGLTDGNAECHTDALYDMWLKETKKEPPPKGRMLDILRFLKNHGLIDVKLPPTFHEGLAFKVRPSITLAAAAEPLNAVRRYAKAAQDSDDSVASESESVSS